MRFYEPKLTQADLGREFVLSSENSHHFSRVLRGRIGQCVRLFNGLGGAFSAEVSQVTKYETMVQVQAFLEENPGPVVPIELVVGITDKRKMAFIVEKAVELGVSCIYPLCSERAQAHHRKHFDEKNMQRYQKVIISAAAQSGINQLPTVCPPVALQELPWQRWEGAAQCYVCDPCAHGEGFHKGDQKRIIFIGPEGGWSDQEMLWLVEHHCQKIHLAQSVLRMETAVVAALARAQV